MTSVKCISTWSKPTVSFPGGLKRSSVEHWAYCTSTSQDYLRSLSHCAPSCYCGHWRPSTTTLEGLHGVDLCKTCLRWRIKIRKVDSTVWSKWSGKIWNMCCSRFLWNEGVKILELYNKFWILIAWNIRQILDHTKPTTTLHSCPKSPTVGRLNICVYIQWLFVFWIYISITNMLCQISKMSNPRPRLRTWIKDFLRHGKWHGWAHRTPKISTPVFRETRESLNEH